MGGPTHPPNLHTDEAVLRANRLIYQNIWMILATKKSLMAHRTTTFVVMSAFIDFIREESF